MRIGSWHFTPGLWPSLACVLLLLLLLRLGFWQLERAGEKQALQARYQSRIAAAPVRLAHGPAWRNRAADMYWRRCILTGRYDPRRVYLLDNQVLRGTAGYQIFSRFVLEDGAAVLVNRGWTAAPGGSRSQAPQIITPRAPATLTGLAAPPPAAGLRLGTGAPEILSRRLVRVQRIDLEQIASHDDGTLLPYVVRLDPATGPGPAQPGFGRERHLGYAFQWFALALALLVIYVAVNTKKQRIDEAGHD